MAQVALFGQASHCKRRNSRSFNQKAPHHWCERGLTIGCEICLALVLFVLRQVFDLFIVQQVGGSLFAKRPNAM